MSQDISVSKLTGYGLYYRGSIPGKGWVSFLRRLVQIGNRPHTVSLPMVPGAFPGNLEPRLRSQGIIHPPPYIFML